MGQARERQVDEACSGKSRDATNNAGNATGETRHAGDKAANGQAEHAPRAATETRTAEHSAGPVAKSTAAEANADAAFYAASEAGTGNEAGAAFESVDTAGAK